MIYKQWIKNAEILDTAETFYSKKIQDSLMIIGMAQGGKKRGVLRQRGKDRRNVW